MVNERKTFPTHIIESNERMKREIKLLLVFLFANEKVKKKLFWSQKNENTTWNKLPEVQDKDWNEVKPCCTWFTHCNRHSAVCTYLPLPNGKQYAKIFSSRCSNKLSFNIFGKTFWWFIEIVFPLPKNNNFKWYAQRKLGEFSFVCV